MGVILALIAVPPIILLVLLSDPFNTRYPAWLVRGVEVESVGELAALMSCQTVLYAIYILPTITVIGCLIFLTTGSVLYFHKVAVWLRVLKQVSGEKESREGAIRVYKKLQVLHGAVSCLIRSFLVPFGLWSTYVCCIQVNFMLITRRTLMPTPVVFINILVTLIGSEFIVQSGQTTATVHILSGQLLRGWRQAARQNRDPYLKTLVRACPQLSVAVGSFFILKKSTTYKMVLFLVLHTFKAVLMFRGWK